MPPTDIGLDRLFEGSAHTYRLIDILSAIDWPWHLILGMVVAVVVIGAFCSWRNR